MGIFFTSTQINNPKQLNCDGFKAYFCEKMKKEGYEVCEADCAELSYVFAFADNCKWVTISSESYEQGNRTAQADTARIAKMLKTTCINTTVIDSDCAMLDLYDDKGKKADTLVMGRADDYLGDDIPAPAQAVWEQFVSSDSTWEQFMSVVQGDYVFVEDGLSELAPVIGMDSDNILFEYEDADESNEKLCYLSFRKASSKKEKKLTINAAFKQIIGEALEPYGFKIIKGRHPYIVRVINNEILHIITFCPESPEYPEDKAFAIMCGVATIYRKKITFDLSPKENHEWLDYMSSFYTALTHENDSEILGQLYKSCFYSDKADSLTSVLTANSESIIKYVLPIMDKIKDIDSCLDYMQEFMMPCNTKKCAKICTYYPDEDESFLYFLSEKIKKNPPGFLNSFLNDNEFHSQTLEELARRKKYNLEMLKSYGIDSEKTQPKKEKKLTLNAAFKQVFGEALEPLGFIKAKTHHPCFLHAVGDEIIHVINLSCCGTRISTNSGVMTVYRPKIDLNDHKWDNKWLYSTEKFYSKINVVSFDEKYWNENLKIEYTLDNEESLINALKKALEEVKKWVLAILNDVKTVKDIIDYQHRLGVTAQYFAVCDNIYLNHETPCSDGAILFALDDPYYYPKRIKELLQTQLDFEIEHGIHFFGKETYEETCERFDKNLAERIAQIDDVINNKHFYEQTIAELQRRKKANLEILKSYGIDSEKTQPKKEKKLTLNAAFKQVFGEALEPLGYKKVNGSNPYFVRVIGNEIIHVITIVTKSTAPGLKLFEICGDVRSIYNSSNYFSKKPEDAYRESYFDISNFKVYSYRLHHEDYDFDYQRKISGFLCNDDNASIINKMNEALETSQELLLPFIDSINNIDELYKYLLQYHSSKLYSWQELLYLRISNYSDIISELRQTANDVYYKCVELKRNGYTEEEYKRRITKADQVDQRRRNAIKEVRDNPKQYAEYMKNEEEAKEGTIKVLKNFGIILLKGEKTNLEIIKSYGIDSEPPQPKKEKKLTINVAFKQVFGELLEPMGFKLIKSKYPYYLRVVGEGIIQAISFAKKKSLNLDLNRDEEEVEIYVGISLLSNPLINFDKNPTIIDNQVWMISLNELYRRFIVYMDGFNRKHEEYSFFYQKGNIEEVLNALKQSRDELMPFVLEFLEKPKTLEDIYRLGEITSGIHHDTIILLQKIDELIKELKENVYGKIEMQKKGSKSA